MNETFWTDLEELKEARRGIHGMDHPECIRANKWRKYVRRKITTC